MPGRSPDADRPRPSRLRALAFNGAHLAALSAFALAEPLFDLLGKNADFFAVRGSSGSEIVLFALAVTFVPPAALLAVEALVGLVSARLQQIVHLVFVGALAGTIAVQALKKGTSLEGTDALIALAAFLGLAAALVYAAIPAARFFVTILAPTPLVFCALFLLNSPVSELAFSRQSSLEVAGVSAGAPVVMVVFDEFPTSDLVGADGRIDAGRFPNFARLAQNAIWYRHATTTSAGTTRAVPAILTGDYTKEGALPIAADHPHSIFTLLGGAYRMNDFETETHLCPSALCESTAALESSTARPGSLYRDVGIIYLHLLAPPRLETTLPSISRQWMNFGEQGAVSGAEIRKALLAARQDTSKKRSVVENRTRRRLNGRFYDARGQLFERFVRSIRRTKRPSLNFLHIVVPHVPWRYFPDGRQYAADPTVGFGSNWLQFWQRHLLQVGFADKLLGDLIGRLRSLGLYDRSIIVVTVDEGLSFRPDETQRGTTKDNLQDLAFVPLFLKKPYQQTPEIADYHVETSDIVPTIAELLGIRIPWQVDGRSVLRDPNEPLVHIAQIERLSTIPVHDVVPYAPLEARQEAAVRRKLAIVGAGSWSRLFASGPDGDLVGRSVAALPVTAPSGDRVEVRDDATRQLLDDYVPSLPFVPSPIPGRVAGPGAGPGRMLALALNGTVVAVTQTFGTVGNIRFAELAPDSAFRGGANDVAFYWVDGTGTGARLVPLALS